MKALNMLRLTFFIVLISLLRTDGYPVMTLVNGVSTILKLGFQIKGVLDQFDAGGEMKADLERITSTLSERIDSSTTRIITNVILQSKLERIVDAVINIRSSLIDLRLLFMTTSHNERAEREKLFVDRFDEHDVIKHLRFLPELLEYNIPGTTYPLLQLYADQTRCNMTALNEFRLYYFTLVSSGIAIHIAYMQLTSPYSMHLTVTEWNRRVGKMKYIFDEQNSKCVDRFDDYATEDIEAANEAMTLWKHNNERYTWKTNDVMFLSPYGTHQFIYFYHSSDLFHHKSDKYKFAIFSDKTDVNPGSSILSHEIESIKSAIAGDSDKSAAMNVARAVKSRLQDRGYKIKNILVFFDGYRGHDWQDLASDAILMHKDSPVIRVTLDNVALRYCKTSSMQCYFDERYLHPNAWMAGQTFVKNKLNVYGKMEVFAYVSSASSDIAHKTNPNTNIILYKTGAAAPNAVHPLFLYILLALCVQMAIEYGYFERF